jgi:hypothetical protein
MKLNGYCPTCEQPYLQSRTKELEKTLLDAYDALMDVDMKYGFRGSELWTRIREVLDLDKPKHCPKCAAKDAHQ